MADTTAAPAAVTTAAPAPVVDKPKPAPLGKASDLAKEVLPPADPKGSSGVPAQATAPGDTVSTSATSTEPSPSSSAPTGELTRLVKEKRRLDKARAALDAEKAAGAETAAKWKAAQEAKGKGDRLAALRVLFDDGEIESGLYEDLTAHIYGKGAAGDTLTKADADAIVEKRLAAAKKADADAAEKAAADAASARQRAETETHAKYLGYVSDAFAAARDKYPALAAVLDDLPGAISGQDIVAFAGAHFREHGKAPSADDVLAHFDGRLRKRFAPATEQKPIPGTVTAKWSNDVTPSARKPPRTEKELRDSLEEAKRAAWGQR